MSGRYPMYAAAGTLAMHAAKQGVTQAIRRYGYRAPSKYPRRSMRRPRDYRFNAEMTKRPKYMRRSEVFSSETLAKGSLLLANCITSITESLNEGYRLTDQIFVKGIYVDLMVDNNSSSSGTIFRWVMINPADYEITSGNSLFQDLPTIGSTAVDFSAADNDMKRQGLIHKTAMGVLKEQTFYIGARASTANSAHFKHVRCFIPVNRLITFEGTNPVPNIRMLSWHYPMDSTQAPTVTARVLTTVLYKNVV